MYEQQILMKKTNNLHDYLVVYKEESASEKRETDKVIKQKEPCCEM